jgi:putative transposase
MLSKIGIGSIRKLDDRNYVVNSQSENGSYNVQLTELGFTRSCEDHLYRAVKCKHIHAVDALRELE